MTAPGQAEINSVEELAGKEIVVPVASSYFESVVAMNRKLIAGGYEPMKITVSDPRLEIEDLVEMMDANLIPMTVADSHRMQLWSRVFKKVKVHEDIVFREFPTRQ